MNDEALLNYLQKTREEYYLSRNENEKNRIGATQRSNEAKFMLEYFK
ncbi:hypothetical protein NXV05_12750 [Parabacteroides johnsonii]|nr:hypothetical protein [Parabacteroides johnsonii]MCS3050775.1 hypothetical protein [Parabacteroides johnsonii]